MGADTSYRLTFIGPANDPLDKVRRVHEVSCYLRPEERTGVIFFSGDAPSGACVRGILLPRGHDVPPCRKGLTVFHDGKRWMARGALLRSPSPVEVAAFSDSFVRTPFKKEYRRVLRDTTVMFFGLGSVGCKIRDLCVRAGIGGEILADIDRVSIENMSRHNATLLDLNRYKCDLEAEYSRLVNPLIRIATCHEDFTLWSPQDRRQFMQAADVVVESTDKQSVSLAVMHTAFELRKPVVFAGSYEDGNGGEVWAVTSDPSGPCYGCLPRGQRGPRNQTLDYSTATSSEDYVGGPGLGAAVSTFAAIGAQYVLALALRKTDCALAEFLKEDVHHRLLVGSATSKDFHIFEAPFQNIFQPVNGISPVCRFHHEAAHLKAISQACKARV
jgi:molybdopterin/thiamine biosynthesis adenylyltransferase